MTITLHGERLKLDFRVINPSEDQSFDFTAALHSYFEVLDVDAASVVGLTGKVPCVTGEGVWSCYVSCYLICRLGDQKL